ncbi:hypothetical protein K438DRAFT_1612760, partial [Mycena galopus ATCC 62051]
SKVASNILRVKLSDLVGMPCHDIKYGKRARILPFDHSIEGLSGNIFNIYLEGTYLRSATGNCCLPLCIAYRPVRKGDIFLVRGGMGTSEFMVIQTDPTEFLYRRARCCDPHQQVFFVKALRTPEGDPVKREDEESNLFDVGYDDTGGCRKQLAQIRGLVELSLRHLQIHRHQPPRGILMLGPLGTDKILMARVVANVSHPDSPNYGNHWSPARVAAHFAPSDEPTHTVVSRISDSPGSRER